MPYMLRYARCGRLQIGIRKHLAARGTDDRLSAGTRGDGNLMATAAPVGVADVNVDGQHVTEYIAYHGIRERYLV